MSNSPTAALSALGVSIWLDDLSRDRIHVAADVAGSSNYEVTFYAKAGHGRWHAIGTDDTGQPVY